jgi:uncharacterized protein (TIGR00369 family)
MSTTLEEIVSTVVELPFHKYLGLRLIDDDRPEAGVALTVDDSMLNAVGVLHGGVYPACLDVAAYLAVLPHLRDGQHATTVSATSSIMRSAVVGDTVQFVGEVTRTGRTLAFTEATALRDGQTIAACSLVKAIVPRPGAA